MDEPLSSTLSEASAVELDGVPETMLWPLWNRGVEHGRDDRLIDDPLAPRTRTIEPVE